MKQGERAITIGRGQMNFGLSFQNVRFDSFEGIDLDTGNINFAAVHSDCCPPGRNAVSVPTDDPLASTPRFPFFEPSGQQLGFWADGELKRMTIPSGPLIRSRQRQKITESTCSNSVGCAIKMPSMRF